MESATVDSAAQTGDRTPHHSIAIIGSGFSGLGMAIRLKQQGIEDFVVLERADDVGGTWRDNTYPGCQCDVPSHLYSFSFALNPGWSRTYSGQQEIWDYLRRCSDEHGIGEHLRFGHEVQGIVWNEDGEHWEIQTSAGDLTAGVVVAGQGGLSEPSLPDIPGVESFAGTWFHSAQWNHEHDLSGERVATIGTGASAIQFVPKIQPQVGKLHVFQRTPPWIMPHTDRSVTDFERLVYRVFPPAQRAVRASIYWLRELLVIGLTKERRILKLLQGVARKHLHAQVKDPELRAALTPDYEIGCKRILLSDDWYPALTKPNVEVVTDGISEIRPHSIVTADGTEREVDTIVFGTGFHVTDTPFPSRVRGRGGVVMTDTWKGSPQAYLGTTVAGFPNLFFLVGPNTGLGHNSIVFMIESQLNYILDALKEMRQRGAATVEVRPEAQEHFNAAIQKAMPGTVWTAGGCSSWYIDKNGLNTTIWPGFTWRYRQITRHFDPERYELKAGSPALGRVAA